jgi:hypothetical protein
MEARIVAAPSGRVAGGQRLGSAAVMSSIASAPHGQNLAIETKSGRVVIGRFDSTNGFQVFLHDVDVWDPPAGADVEHYIRETATYGVDVKQRDFTCDAASITRWRKLGEIQKLA